SAVAVSASGYPGLVTPRLASLISSAGMPSRATPGTYPALIGTPSGMRLSRTVTTSLTPMTLTSSENRSSSVICSSVSRARASADDPCSTPPMPAPAIVLSLTKSQELQVAPTLRCDSYPFAAVQQRVQQSDQLLSPGHAAIRLPASGNDHYRPRWLEFASRGHVRLPHIGAW